MSIGDKLRSIDEHAGRKPDIASNEPTNKEQAEGSRENDRQPRVPPRRSSKEDRGA
jgi:hypothetical protein